MADSMPMIPALGVVPEVGHGLVPVIQVKYYGGMWWTMPRIVSDPLIAALRAGMVESSYVWDWGRSGKKGTYKDENGQPTTYNRYVLNFNKMLQTNSDTKCVREVCIVYMRDQDTQMGWGGHATPLALEAP